MYLKKGCPVNLFHLQKRMEQSGKWNPAELLTEKKLKELLEDRFKTVDFDSAREDVSPFLAAIESEGLSLWDAEFFIDITERYLNIQ